MEKDISQNLSSTTHPHNLKRALRLKYEKEQFSKNNQSNIKSDDNLVTPSPPLPPYPPPQDGIKLEIECTNDDDDGAPKVSSADELSTENGPKHKVNQDKIMCKQFVRGLCPRGPACLYAHEIIVSQLPSVYTFCRNFQNTVCTLPNCKFVHATIFEKEAFLRTGYLPEHTLAHRNQPNPSSLIVADGKGGSSQHIIPPRFQREDYIKPHATKRRYTDSNANDSAHVVESPPPIKKCKNCELMDNCIEILTKSIAQSKKRILIIQRKAALMEKLLPSFAPM